MIKDEDDLFHLREGLPIPESDPDVRVTSGALEGSNVNAVDQLTQVIAASRLFEMNVKMMENAKSNDETTARILHT